MPTFDEKRNGMYANLMEEVKVRFECINRLEFNQAG
jgi:hypothetical protein